MKNKKMQEEKCKIKNWKSCDLRMKKKQKKTIFITSTKKRVK